MTSRVNVDHHIHIQRTIEQVTLTLPLLEALDGHVAQKLTGSHPPHPWLVQHPEQPDALMVVERFDLPNLD